MSAMSRAKQPRSPLTHFLCLPLVTPDSRPQLQKSLQQFSADILTSGPDGRGIVPEKAIRPLDTLHLTLGVMTLQEPERLQRAQKLLESINPQHLLQAASAATTEGGTLLPGVPKEVAPLKISLESVVSMHPPASTSILYTTPIDTTNRLGPFCRFLQDTFRDEGLVEDDGRPLLLHATILNTTYASGRGANNRRAKGKTMLGGGGHGYVGGKITFDASDILSRYEDYVFVRDMRIEKIAICRMGAKRTVDEETGSTTERYEVDGEIPLS
jgi:activating signal cointegrator complex subunit 1